MAANRAMTKVRGAIYILPCLYYFDGFLDKPELLILIVIIMTISTQKDKDALR